MRDLTRQTPIAIISLNTDNRENESRLLDVLGFNFLPLVRVCKGKEELSYAIFLAGDFTLGAVTDLAKGFSQESILVANEWRESYLLFLKDRTKKYIGILKEVYEKEAKAQDNYTYNPKVDRYYICK